MDELRPASLQGPDELTADIKLVGLPDFQITVARPVDHWNLAAVCRLTGLGGEGSK
jgi:hypothetical protein